MNKSRRRSYFLLLPACLLVLLPSLTLADLTITLSGGPGNLTTVATFNGGPLNLSASHNHGTHVGGNTSVSLFNSDVAYGLGDILRFNSYPDNVEAHWVSSAEFWTGFQDFYNVSGGNISHSADYSGVSIAEVAWAGFRLDIDPNFFERPGAVLNICAYTQPQTPTADPVPTTVTLSGQVTFNEPFANFNAGTYSSNHFGGAPGDGMSIVVTPEPSAAILLLGSGAMLLLRRPRAAV